MGKKSDKSGEPEPSEQDRKLTIELKQACNLIGINLVDHIVVGMGNIQASWTEGERAVNSTMVSLFLQHCLVQLMFLSAYR
jgi:hypothetical protein